MTGIKKESNTFYITHSGELLIWLIVILVVVSISTIAYFIREKNSNDYSIFMPDVDGLIVGSPVRMMGIEVGHVTKIKPTNEEVYVKFILTDESLQIPRGTAATVEFSGMAGSKSLELYLPDKQTYIDKNTPFLTVHPPKRLHDALGLLNDMFKKLSSIIYTTSSFTEQTKFIPASTGNDETISDFINYTDNIIDDTNKKAEDFGNKINKYKNGVMTNGKK